MKHFKVLATFSHEGEYPTENEGQKSERLNDRVVELENENKRTDDTISELEKAVDSLETYSKKNNVVFSGLDLKSTTFARVARVAGTTEEQGLGEQSGGEFATLRSKILGFVNHTMNVRMERNYIVACHGLPARNNDTVKPIIGFIQNQPKIHRRNTSLIVWYQINALSDGITECR